MTNVDTRPLSRRPMRSGRRMFAWIGLMVALPFVLPAALAGPVQRTVLGNGLEVLVEADRRAPTVVQLIAYRVGSADEQLGVTGIAHLLEHLMFKGTVNTPAGDFSRRVAQAGGRENAFTTRHYTAYYQQVGKDLLADIMRLEADRMRGLVIDDTAFARERDVVREERRLRVDDQPYALVSEQLMATALQVSPYRRPVTGWPQDLAGLRAADARAWYDAWYAPNNAVLFIAGDVDPDEVFRLAQAHYGGIPTQALPRRLSMTEPEQRGMRRAIVRARADVPYLVLAFRVPQLDGQPWDDAPFALQVMASVLGSSDTGRLTRELVRGQRLANQAGASYGLVTAGPALFTLSATPADGQSLETLESALRAQIARIASDGISEAELQRVKTAWLASEVYRQDSVMSRVMQRASLTMAGLAHDDGQALLERVTAVTAAQVQAVARAHFTDETLTVVTLLPQDRPQAPDGLPAVAMPTEKSP